MPNEPLCDAPEHDLLPDLSDGRLAASETARVEAHLATCAAGRAELAGLRALADAASGSHLDTSEIIAYAWDGVPEGETHLDFCERCLEEVKAVRGAQPPLDAEGAALSAPSARSSSFPWRFWPGLLAAALVVGLGLVFVPDRASNVPSPPSVRGGLRSIENLNPTGPVARGGRELVLSWNAPSDRRFSLSFLSVDGRLIRRVETFGNRWTLSGLDLELLEREKEFFWKVEALNGEGLSSEKVARITWLP